MYRSRRIYRLIEILFAACGVSVARVGENLFRRGTTLAESGWNLKVVGWPTATGTFVVRCSHVRPVLSDRCAVHVGFCVSSKRRCRRLLSVRWRTFTSHYFDRKKNINNNKNNYRIFLCKKKKKNQQQKK